MRVRARAERRAIERTQRPLFGPYALLGGAQLAVGAAAIFARYALTGAGPLAVSASRLAIAAGVLLIIAAVRGERTRPLPPQAFRLALAGCALAVHFAGWIASLQYTTVAVSTLLVATTPIWTALYDAVARKRLPSTRTLWAFAGGGAGLALVVGFNATPPPIPGRPLLGAALALIGSIAMAAYLLLVRDVRGSLGTRTIVTRTYTWAALVLVAAAAIARQPAPALADLPAWGGILGMALVSQLLGHTALNAALRWFSPSAVAFSTLIEPVSAAVLAFFIFAETLGPVAIVGAIVLLAAVGIVLREESASFDYGAVRLRSG